MHPGLKLKDPWSQIVKVLRGRTGTSRIGGSCDCAAMVADVPVAQPIVDVVERPTSTTATIYWRDATRCCYGHQTWRTSRARSAGVCAMSGRVISRGDYIYRPSSRSGVCNGYAMILASVLEGKN